jgi:hypothetical protein
MAVTHGRDKTTFLAIAIIIATKSHTKIAVLADGQIFLPQIATQSTFSVTIQMSRH